MSLNEWLIQIALLTGFGCLAIGIVAAIRPRQMSEQFGISAKEQALPYVVSTGIRDVFMGLVILIAYIRKDFNLLGLVHLCLVPVAVSDFLIVMKNGDRKKAITHVGGAVIVLAYGLILLSL